MPGRRLGFIGLAALLSLLSASTAGASLEVRELAPSIFYGPAPKSAADYLQLRRLGIKTLLDLRRFWRREIERERCLARRFGFAWRHVSMGFHPLRDGSPECALRVMTDAARQPVYVHCNYGRDRTGLVVALYRVRWLGWGRQNAFAAMKRDQFNSRLKGLDDYFWQRWRGGLGPARSSAPL